VTCSAIPVWGARASRVLVAVSRRNNLFCSLERNPRSAINKVRGSEDAFTPAGAGRDACAPRKPRECASGYQLPL
jgi:hypothetical protein